MEETPKPANQRMVLDGPCATHDNAGCRCQTFREVSLIGIISGSLWRNEQCFLHRADVWSRT